MELLDNTHYGLRMHDRRDVRKERQLQRLLAQCYLESRMAGGRHFEAAKQLHIVIAALR
jgi:hypothetical protein